MPRLIGRIKQRRDFLRLAAGKKKSVATGLIMQSLPAMPPDRAGAQARGRRVGFTATKKIGNAVTRNRAKRRLRAAVQAVMVEHAAPQHDYVLIARNETPDRPFPLLLGDVRAALKRLGVWRD